MYDLTRVGLDAVTAELNYRHSVDLTGRTAAGSAVPAAHRRVLRRRIVRHGRIRHGEIR